MRSARISLNKLGEYLNAHATRRRRIILDQQEPKAFVAARYMDAREAIVDFLVSGRSDTSILEARTNELREDGSGSEFAIQDRLASADAIDAFLTIANDIHLGELVPIPVANNSSEGMTIAGVYVSVRPDVYLKNWITGEVEGAIKLHFPKTTPLGVAGAEFVATGMRYYLENEKGLRKVDFRKCLVVDVPESLVVSAPRAFVRKMNDITAACEEIYARWSLGSAAA